MYKPTDGGFVDARASSQQKRPLKIIVAGTPKSGNHWIKFLLGETYGLTYVALQPDFRADDWARFGDRWIGHQHYMPGAELLERARAHGVRFVTTVRHPADVLVSLRQYVEKTRTPASDPRAEASMLLDGPGVYGEHTRAYLEHGFYLALHASICWSHIPDTLVVRYEELWRNTIETMRHLADRIEPVAPGRLEAAIAVCQIDKLRATYGNTVFRRGGAGRWRTELPREIQQYLANWDPYPAQFAALGYTMKFRENEAHVAEENAGRFDNGTPIAPFLREAFVATAARRAGGWPDITETGPGSFFAWLNQPAAIDPWRGNGFPVITELAYYTYMVRTDAQEEYPEPFGRHRVEFGNWFIYFGVKFCGLDEAFALPVLGSVDSEAPVAATG